MIKTLPGTVIEAEFSPDTAMKTINSLFMAGGLMLSQVSRLTGLEPYIIQNWVRRGFLPPPNKKLYSKDQFCRIVIINMLRQSLQIEAITKLLSAINGHLDDESDDSITDSELYYLFLFTAHRAKTIGSYDFSKATLSDAELRPHIKRADDETAIRRIHTVTELMCYAYQSTLFKAKAEQLLGSVE